jgi:hypothetical protein
MMSVYEIGETPEHLHSVLLPPCRADVLLHVLVLDVPYVWLLDYKNESLATDVRNAIRLPFTQAKQEVLCNPLLPRLDLCFHTSDFLLELPYLKQDGVDVIQAETPLPRSFRYGAVSPAAWLRVCMQLGIHLIFHLPHEGEHALVKAPVRESLVEVVRRVRPVLTGACR